MEDNVDNMQTNWPICMKRIFRFNEEAGEKAIENTAKGIGLYTFSGDYAIVYIHGPKSYTNPVILLQPTPL